MTLLGRVVDCWPFVPETGLGGFESVPARVIFALLFYFFLSISGIAEVIYCSEIFLLFFFRQVFIVLNFEICFFENLS